MPGGRGWIGKHRRQTAAGKGACNVNGLFSSTAWNTSVLAVMGLIAIFTREVVTFIMLGFVIVSLSNIFNVLQEISSKLDKQP